MFYNFLSKSAFFGYLRILLLFFVSLWVLAVGWTKKAIYRRPLEIVKSFFHISNEKGCCNCLLVVCATCALEDISAAEGEQQRAPGGNKCVTFQSPCLLAVVLAVLVDLLDFVLELPDFSCHVREQQTQGDMKVSTECHSVGCFPH